jgi:hypothetical protein
MIEEQLGWIGIQPKEEGNWDPEPYLALNRMKVGSLVIQHLAMPLSLLQERRLLPVEGEQSLSSWMQHIHQGPHPVPLSVKFK